MRFQPHNNNQRYMYINEWKWCKRIDSRKLLSFSPKFHLNTIVQQISHIFHVHIFPLHICTMHLQVANVFAFFFFFACVSLTSGLTYVIWIFTAERYQLSTANAGYCFPPQPLIFFVARRSAFLICFLLLNKWNSWYLKLVNNNPIQWIFWALNFVGTWCISAVIDQKVIAGWL